MKTSLFLSYDKSGFDAAIEGSEVVLIETEEEYYQIMEFLIDWGIQDLLAGLCKSMQIYNHLGEIVFDTSHLAAA